VLPLAGHLLARCGFDSTGTFFTPSTLFYLQELRRWMNPYLPSVMSLSNFRARSSKIPPNRKPTTLSNALNGE